MFRGPSIALQKSDEPSENHIGFLEARFGVVCPGVPILPFEQSNCIFKNHCGMDTHSFSSIASDADGQVDVVAMSARKRPTRTFFGWLWWWERGESKMGHFGPQNV